MIQLSRKEECCGCSACANICPRHWTEMRSDKEGFLYPVVDAEKCINCKMCQKVCPMLNCAEDNAFSQTAYLVRANDEQICNESTSGGAFTLLAQKVIGQGGVVFGAAFDDDFRVVHTYAEHANELKKFRNSKYVQSKIGETFEAVKTFIKNNRLVLFSGTPCQVEGLYHFLNGRVERVILVDTVCRAVPSPLIWEKYKEFRQPNPKDKLVAASFRDKGKYGYQYSQMKMAYESGEVKYSGVESDPYLRAFFSDLSDRPSCYECKFKKRYRVSDITIWDCFDVYRLDKQFDDNKGVTRLLVHSEKGVSLVRTLPDAKVIEVDAEDAVKGVKELVESVKSNPNRRNFFDDATKMESYSFMNKWFPDNLRVKVERLVRHGCERLGIYRIAKRVMRKILGKE